MPNISPYIPTYLNITGLLSGYIAIYDDSPVQQYYQDTNGVIELPYSANGTWSYKIARYGSKLITGVFTIDRSAGGTVAISPVYVQDTNVVGTLSSVSAYNIFSSTQEIYDYLSYYRTTSAGLAYGDLNLYSSTLDLGTKNVTIYDSASSGFDYNGSRFLLKANNLSGGSIVTSGTFTISGTSSISDISITSNVVDQTPADLNNVTINGILSYNTNTPASIVYTNTTVSTVANIGTATVLIKRINSNINNDTDPEIDSYAPTLINVTPLSGSVAIYNQDNVRQSFITVDTSLVLAAAASGTWAYRVAKYGKDSIYQTFTINRQTGATININPNYVTDLFATDALSAVSAYTDLNTPDKIHDYLSYYQTTSAGIDYGDLESESFGAINFNSSLTINPTATSLVNYSGGILTLKASSITGNINFVINGDLVLSGSATISDGIKVRSNNFDSEIYFYNITSITLFPSISDRDNNTNPGQTATGAIYRFKYGSTYNGVTMSDLIYARVTTGGVTLIYSTPITTGSTSIDLGVVGTLQSVIQNQKILNTGIQKSSKLIPHTTNLAV
jgi:hypothetical protein